MQELSKLTFLRGMNTDIDKAVRDGQSYYRAENFTSTSEGDGTIGSLENSKGNQQLTEIVFAANHVVVGVVPVVRKHVYFTTDGSTSNIYLHDNGVFTLLYSDSSSTYKLNFSTDLDNRIVGVGRQETTSIEKVYWVDGLNEYRYIDLNRDYTGLEANVFNVTPPNDITADIKTEVLPSAGQYLAGSVYHTYQFYTTNGASSTISSASHVSRLSQYTTVKDGGNDIEEDSGCAVRVTISNIDSTVLANYNRVRVYAIYYQDDINPIVNIVAEKSLMSDTITVIDTGKVLDTLELDQYLSYNQTSYIPNAITSNKNNLLIGNLKESTFSDPALDAWDARAYRFYGLGNTAEIVSASDASQYIRVDDGTAGYAAFKVASTNIPGVVLGDDVPEDFDCVNEYNNIYTDSLYDRTLGNGGLRYQSDHTTIGGEGLNLSYEFADRGKVVGTGNSLATMNTNRPVVNQEGDTYTDSSETVELDMSECQDGEVYRVGIKFYNDKGQSSFVKWIGDILWEEHYTLNQVDPNYTWTLGLTNSALGADGSPHYTGYKVSRYGISGADTDKSTVRAKVLRVTLKNNTALTAIKNAGVTSWQIVRAERTSLDRTVIGNGALMQTFDTDTAGIERPRAISNLSGAYWDGTKTLFKFISPELQMNDPSDLDLSNYKFRIYNRLSQRLSSSSATFPSGATTAYKYTELKGLSSSGATTTQNLIGINDYKWVTPQYKQDGISDVSVSVGTYTYLNQDKTPGTDTYGAGSSAFVVDLDSVPNIVAGSDDSDLNVLYASLVKNTDSTRYGGVSHQDILNTVYIPFSSVEPITTTIAYGVHGDVTTTIYYEMEALFYDDSGDSAEGKQNFLAFPVQSTIDTRRRQDRILDFFNGYDTLNGAASWDVFMFIAETVEKGIELFNVKYDPDIGDLYVYNPAYSTDPTFEISIPKPFDFTEETHSTTKILASEKKINGESEDSWTNFLANNFIEVDAAYGGINTLLTKDNSTFFWQDKAFGTVAVNDRSLITDQAGSQLALGTGAVLERYDYISTVIGSVDRYNISASENALFWLYSPKGRIYTFSNQLQELSTTAGVNAYLKSKDVTVNPIVQCDFINNETLFKVEDEVLVYDWLTNAFTGVYTYDPDWFIPTFSGNVYSIPSTASTVWEHNIESNRCTYYGTTYDSTIKHICTKDYPLTKTYDVLSWHSTATGSDGIITYGDTFTDYRMYNDYQNTDWQTIDWVRKERNYNTIIPRDIVDRTNNSPKDDIDIFDPANLDETQQFKQRIRDKYMVLDLKYNNDGSTRFYVPYIDVYHRKSIR